MFHYADEIAAVFERSVHVRLLQTTTTIEDDIARFAEMLPEDPNWDCVRSAMAIWRSRLMNCNTPVPFVMHYQKVLEAILEALLNEHNACTKPVQAAGYCAKCGEGIYFEDKTNEWRHTNAHSTCTANLSD